MKNILYILTLLLFSVTLTFGQSGQIKGYVHDVNKDQPVILATVFVGTEKSVTDFDGQFKFPNIKVGRYQLKIIGNAQTDTLIATIEVNPDSTTNLYFSYPYSCPYIKSKNVCPVCSKTDKVIPIIYGEPTTESLEKSENGKVKLAGCLVSNCDPNWYCKRDKKEF